MTDAPAIAPAGPEAAGIAARLHAASFAGRERAWSAAEIAALLAAPECFLLLAGGAGAPAPAALLLGRAAGGEAELLTLGTAPEARRAGLGAALTAGFAAEARARGAETAFLEVAADNDGAASLYRRLGWVAAGRRKGYVRRLDGGRVDALVMRLDLNGDGGGEDGGRCESP